jgi:hypothetical protein
MAREPSRKRKQNLEVLRSPDSTSESRGERVIGESRSLAISRRKFIGAASGGLGLAVIGLGSAASGLAEPCSISEDD